MYRCSASSLLCGKNVTFTIQHDTNPGEVLYIVGSKPQLGAWQVAKAKRMAWNCGNVWDVEIGFPEGSHLEYKYFVVHEESRDVRWESGKNREVWIEDDNAIVDDLWNTAGL